jgi:hypothetical protein
VPSSTTKGVLQSARIQTTATRQICGQQKKKKKLDKLKSFKFKALNNNYNNNDDGVRGSVVG